MAFSDSISLRFPVYTVLYIEGMHSWIKGWWNLYSSNAGHTWDVKLLMLWYIYYPYGFLCNKLFARWLIHSGCTWL